MKISKISHSVNTKSPSFQKGLPDWYTRRTFTWLPEEVEAIMKGKGVEASFKDKLAVAAACLTTAEIFQHYKLKLPTKFSFEPLEHKKVNGEYEWETNTVFINSDQEFFTAPVAQDFHETISAGSAATKHFLHTYIHEFMHSAHFQHINDKDKYRALSKYAPTALLVDPINAFVKKFVPWFCEDKIDEKYPPNFGYYAYQNLNEFAAERGTFLISQDLNSDLIVDAPSSDSKYTFINPKGETLFEFDKEKTTSKFDKFLEFLYDRQKVLKAIWDGDIETIKSPENKRFIKEI